MQRNMIIWLLIGVIIAVFPSYSFANSDNDIVLIVHKNVNDSLTKDEVQQVFLGKKTRWSNNTTIRFVVLTKEDVYEMFLKDYVGKTVLQYMNYWKKQVFTGKGRMPKTFETSQEIMDYVSQTEGAMSFVPSQAIDQGNVNIIAIEP